MCGGSGNCGGCPRAKSVGCSHQRNVNQKIRALERQKQQLCTLNAYENPALCGITDDAYINNLIRNVNDYHGAVLRFEGPKKDVEAAIQVLSNIKTKLLQLRTLATNGAAAADQTTRDSISAQYNELLAAVQQLADLYRDPSNQDPTATTSLIHESAPNREVALPNVEIGAAGNAYIYHGCDAHSLIDAIQLVPATGAAQSDFSAELTNIDIAINDDTSGVNVCCSSFTGVLTSMTGFMDSYRSLKELIENNINSWKDERLNNIEAQLDAFRYCEC